MKIRATFEPDDPGYYDDRVVSIETTCYRRDWGECRERAELIALSILRVLKRAAGGLSLSLRQELEQILEVKK